jgi:hypothetical protein
VCSLRDLGSHITYDFVVVLVHGAGGTLFQNKNYKISALPLLDVQERRTLQNKRAGKRRANNKRAKPLPQQTR